MLYYALIGLSLVLVGVAGLQFSYMFYLDRLHLERKKHITTLEKKCIDLTARLEEAELRLAEQEQLLGNAYASMTKGDEVWADVLEDH